MSLSFNNIPNTTRSPGTYNEVDASRALQGLAQNPHKALIIGQKLAAGSAEYETLYAITSELLADSYFESGSILSRMCRKFKAANPNTELFALALNSGDGVIASGAIYFSVALSHAGGSVSTTDETLYLMINGTQIQQTLTNAWSVTDVNSALKTAIDANSALPVIASTTVSSVLLIHAKNSGTFGNFIDIRFNYYAGQSSPTCFGDSATISAMTGGSADPDVDAAWSVIENEQFQYIIHGYTDATNLTLIDTELANRFKPLADQAGYGFTAFRGTQASCTTLGNSRNSPHMTIMGAYDAPNAPEEWAAVLGAVAGFNLNNDPARPLHFLQLPGLLAPPTENRFTRTEREILLYDGIATWLTDSSANVLIERCITTYQKNTLGTPDPTYLDVQTLTTLEEIRYQYKVRMQNRFLAPRFKLADDSFPVQAGSNIATAKTIKSEIISLFALLRDRGLIENLDDFITNLVVERNTTDKNRVDVLLPPDLINQFRVLASLVQFIL